MVVMNNGSNGGNDVDEIINHITKHENISLIVLQVIKHEMCEVIANKYVWLMRYLDFMSDGGKLLFQITFFITCTPLQKFL